MRKPDVYMFGVVAASKMCKLDEGFSFPLANSYAEVKQVVDTVSGEAAGGAIVLARLGLKVRIAGNWLDKKNGPRLKRILGGYGIDTSPLVIKTKYTAAWEIVFADKLTRTPFGRYVDMLFARRQWPEPKTDDVKNARMVAIDPFFPKTSERLARTCAHLGVPYVTIDCPVNSFLCKNAAALIISREYIKDHLKRNDNRKVFREYLANCPGLLACTFGAGDLLYARRGEKTKTFSPFKIKLVDTTGAGDAFRSGVIYGLLRGWNDEQTIEYASAVAALVCASFPAATKAASRAQVDKFIRRAKQRKGV